MRPARDDWKVDQEEKKPTAPGLKNKIRIRVEKEGRICRLWRKKINWGPATQRGFPTERKIIDALKSHCRKADRDSPPLVRKGALKATGKPLPR